MALDTPKLTSISKLRLYIILSVALGFAGLFFGWFMIAEGADFYVRNYIRARSGLYTSSQYTDFLWVYVCLSIVLLGIMLSIRLRFDKWRSKLTVALGVIFSLFLALWIEDDIRFGRPIAPELFFTFVIVSFHLILFSVLTKGVMILKKNKTLREFL